MEALAASIIKPNDRLTSIERLEIYNRQYWFRLLDCLYDDYPGVREILGERRFMKLAKAYLARHPSRSYSLRDLGKHLARFLHEGGGEPEWSNGDGEAVLMAQDMARFEWAQIVAFDGAAMTSITPDHILNEAPSTLRFGLQPYVSLLKLRYAVDEFSVALKKDEALRNEASHAVDAPPKSKLPRRGRRLPTRERVWLAVHRCDNLIYFKRLEPEAFHLLRALRCGLPLEQACEKAITMSRRSDVDWAEKIREWFACWASLGWLTLVNNNTQDK